MVGAGRASIDASPLRLVGTSCPCHLLLYVRGYVREFFKGREYRILCHKMGKVEHGIGMIKWGGKQEDRIENGICGEITNTKGHLTKLEEGS